MQRDRNSPICGLIIGLSLILVSFSAPAQSLKQVTVDSFNKKRFIGLATLSAGIYGTSVYALSKAWYQDNPRTGFQFFNDWGEWNHMDKLGHSYTAYFEAEGGTLGAGWTGMSNKAATWTGLGAAFIMQTTVEMLDAYSEKWGFSWPDMAFNGAGLALFGFQQLHWKEQRIRLKISSSLARYDQRFVQSLSGQTSTQLADRSEELFGSGLLERFLKDYNAQTIWLSVNPKSFWPQAKFPKWLNIAFGYGAENLYGGFSNSWSRDQEIFVLSDSDFPRYRQWYLSPDLDLRRIDTGSKFFNTVLTVVNIFKVPAPAFGFSRGKLQWIWVHH